MSPMTVTSADIKDKDWWVITSQSTHYRSFRGRLNQLVVEITAGPVRTAHISVLLTVNIVSHNPAQSSSDNIPSSPPDNHRNSDVV